VKGVFACAATRVENGAAERAFAGKAQDRRLWSPDIPGGWSVDIRRIPGLACLAFVARRLPSAERIVSPDS
jgi:hypothetical protein